MILNTIRAGAAGTNDADDQPPASPRKLFMTVTVSSFPPTQH